MGKGRAPHGLMMTPATADWITTVAHKTEEVWRDWAMVLELLSRKREWMPPNEPPRLAIIQADAGDPDGDGHSGNWVDVDGVSTEVPIDCVSIKLAELTGDFPNRTVAEIEDAEELICEVPQLNGANAYDREPALIAGKVIDVQDSGGHYRLVGTIFDEWSDECDA